MRFKKISTEEMELCEMSLPRKDALSACLGVGYRFAEHFVKVMEDKDGNKAHHISEMQAFWDSVKRIRMKSNNKLIPNRNIFDWFFSFGGDIEDIVPKGYMDEYISMADKLMHNRDMPIYKILEML